MARRRHQQGRVIVRGKNSPVFVGRWREDVIQGEQTIRVERSMVLGTVAELKTKRIAQRLLDPILARINSFDYRPSKFISVEKFADVWETQVLTHQKPSSVKAVKVTPEHLHPEASGESSSPRTHAADPAKLRHADFAESFPQNRAQRSRDSQLDDAHGEILGILHASESRRANWLCRRMSSASRHDSSTGRKRARSSRSLPSRTARCSRSPQ